MKRSVVRWIQRQSLLSATTAGFEGVKEQQFRLPIGSWPKDKRLKEIGTLMSINFLEGVPAFTSMLFKDILDWSSEEVKVFNASVRSNGSSHVRFRCRPWAEAYVVAHLQQIHEVGQ